MKHDKTPKTLTVARRRQRKRLPLLDDSVHNGEQLLLFFKGRISLSFTEGLIACQDAPRKDELRGQRQPSRTSFFKVFKFS